MKIVGTSDIIKQCLAVPLTYIELPEYSANGKMAGSVVTPGVFDYGDPTPEYRAHDNIQESIGNQSIVNDNKLSDTDDDKDYLDTKEVAPDQMLIVTIPTYPSVESLRRQYLMEANKTYEHSVKDMNSEERVKFERYPIPNITDTNITDSYNVSRRAVDPSCKNCNLNADANLKRKISNLIDQTMNDADVKVKKINVAKNRHKTKAPYKIGFLLSMVKRTRDVLIELFNVAVQHKDDWKALEQLKVFELISHTNKDATNLIRQLVDVHMQNIKNSTDTDTSKKERLVVLK